MPKLLFKNRTLNLNKNGMKIAHQEFNTLCSEFSKIFDSTATILSSNDGRRFSERQAYGLFIQAILKSERCPKFVLTELPVPRNNKDKSSFGRLDFLYYKSSQAFAVELKLVHCGLESANIEKKKISSAWFSGGIDDSIYAGVVGQLKSININDMFFESLPGGQRNLKTIKFPILIVCHHRNHKNGFAPIIKDENIIEKHNGVIKLFEKNPECIPSFSAVYRLSNPQPRKTKNSDRDITIAGLGFFGGAACFN